MEDSVTAYPGSEHHLPPAEMSWPPVLGSQSFPAPGRDGYSDLLMK